MRWYRSPAFWRGARKGFLLGHVYGCPLVGLGLVLHAFAIIPSPRADVEVAAACLCLALSALCLVLYEKGYWR